VLQPLDNTSRLATAATCKRMLDDALQSLAWKHAEALRISDEQLLVQQSRQHAGCSLLQVAPVHLTLYSREVQASQLQLGCIGRFERLEQAEWSREGISPLLQHPAAQQLCQLKLCFDCNLDAQECQLLGTLSRLTCLECSYHASSELSNSLLSSLAQLLSQPHFIELVLRNLQLNEAKAMTHVLHQSAGHLRALRFCCLWLGEFDSASLEMFASLGTALPRLEVLTLSTLNRDEEMAEAHAEVLTRLFASLRSLHTLRVWGESRVDSMLPLVAEIPHLRLFQCSGQPSEAAMNALQEAKPQLRIQTNTESPAGFVFA